MEVFGQVADERHVFDKAPAVKALNHAYENVGVFKFDKKKRSEWFDEIPSYSYGASFADLDNDCNLDYVTYNLNDKAFIYKNKIVENAKGNSNFMRVRLIGKRTTLLPTGQKLNCGAEDYINFRSIFYPEDISHLLILLFILGSVRTGS